jgi:CII-binding regulator of phage lambda lysogenization HflD
LTSAQLTREKEENDTLSNKIFVLENILQKKENIIDSLNKKIQKVNHNTSHR